VTAAVAEGLFYLALLAAPWPYGCAGDVERYALTAWVAGAVALWLAGRAWRDEGVPAPAAAALLLPGLALAQVLLGRAASRQLTLEAVLLLAAGGGAALFWWDRAQDRGAARRLPVIVLAICAAQAVFGAVQWSMAPDRIYGHFATMPFGSFMVHNHFAGLMEMGVVLAAGLAVGHARRGGGLTPGALGLVGLSLALAAAHLASRSRGGILALAGGLAILAALATWTTLRGSVRPRQVALAIAIVAVVVLGFGLAAIPGSARQHLATLLRGTADPSGALRIDLAADTLRLAVSRPILGWGFGAYQDAVQEFRRWHGELRPVHAESDILELLSEGGLLGMLAAAWVGRLVVAGFADRIRHGRDPYRKGIAVGALAAVGTLCLHSALDFNLRIPSNALTFACLLGLAGAPRTPPPAQGRRAPAALAALFALLAAASGWRARGATEVAAGEAQVDSNRQVATLDRVVPRHPYEASARRMRGQAWRELAWQPPRWIASRLARSEADFRGSLAWRPRWGATWVDLGWTLHLMGRQDAAEEAFRRAVALEPTHLALGQSRAEFFARLGRVSEALDELRRLRGVSHVFSLAEAARHAIRWTRDPVLLVRLTDGSPEERQAIAEILARPVVP
jgi:O-antigen ligase